MEKDWRKKILEPSEREKILEARLVQMLRRSNGSLTNSPEKADREKMVTEAQSHSHGQNMGNTLLRYLYEKSIQNASFS